jgi:hypothetical protein
MEGFCRASSPVSIADSPLRINAKWPKNEVFVGFRPLARARTVRLSTTIAQGWRRILGVAAPSRFSEKPSSCSIA